MAARLRVRLDALAPRSSSGPGHRPLKAEIIGSNPIRGTLRYGRCTRTRLAVPSAEPRTCRPHDERNPAANCLFTGLRAEFRDGILTFVRNSTYEDDSVSAEAESLLDSNPGLREDLRNAIAEHRAGTLKTVDTPTVRARLEARIKANKSR